MIGKIIAGSSFGATVGYVMNRCRPEDGEGHRAESIISEAGMDKTERGKVQSRILGFEGIEPPGVQDMVRDFKDQTLLNLRIKNVVGQGGQLPAQPVDYLKQRFFHVSLLFL